MRTCPLKKEGAGTLLVKFCLLFGGVNFEQFNVLGKVPIHVIIRSNGNWYLLYIDYLPVELNGPLVA